MNRPNRPNWVKPSNARKARETSSAEKLPAEFDLATRIIDLFNVMSISIEGVAIPDTKFTSEITQLVRDTESPLLFDHSSRVYYFGALMGKRRGLRFDWILPFIL